MTETQTPKSDTLRDRIEERAETVRSKAVDAYAKTRENVRGNLRTGREEIDKAPLIALAGGLAAGALVAALLPRTRTEDEYLGKTGRKINEAGRNAVKAARTAGEDKLNELNLTRDAGAGLVRSVIEGVGQAARASGDAAVSAVKKD